MPCFIHEGASNNEKFAAGTDVYFEEKADEDWGDRAAAYAWAANECGHRTLNQDGKRFRSRAKLAKDLLMGSTRICRGATEGTETLYTFLVAPDGVTDLKEHDEQPCAGA